MSDMTFTPNTGTIPSTWLNDVNKMTYYGIMPIVGSASSSNVLVTLPVSPLNAVDGFVLIIRLGASLNASATLEVQNGPAAWGTPLPIYIHGSAVGAGVFAQYDLMIASYNATANRWDVK